MNGLELLAHLREAPGHKDIPVIVVTTHGDPVTVARCLEMGARACVQKPVTSAELYKIIEGVTGDRPD
jgi:two-component system chemotaxis response regulator CheY